MKILMLTPYLPYPLVSGGQIRTYNLLKHLSKSHQITLFALIKDYQEEEYLPELKKYCHQIKLFKRTQKPWALRNIVLAGLTPYPFLVTRNWPLSMKKAIKTELNQGQYDLIHAETFYMMPNIPQTNIPIILVEQTIEYLGYQDYLKRTPSLLKPFLAFDVAKIKFWERYYWQKADKLITMSEEDKTFIQQSLPKKSLNLDVVANGVDLDFFSQVKKHLPSNPTVLFVGTFKWLPNVEAVELIIKQIWPLIIRKLPQAKLKIVGFSPTPKIKAYAQDPSIDVLGGIPDIRQAFATSHVLLAPIKSGKGTRFKVLEALITGTPVVATNLAVEGLAVEPGKHVLTSDNPQELARLTLEVLQDKQLQQRLSRSGRQVVRNHYSWDIIAKHLDNIYQEFNHHA